MCRPSCCDNSRGQGTGIAAVGLILGAALIVAKIGPIVAQIVHVALEVIRVAALTAGAVLTVAAAAWLAVMTVRWWLHHRRAQRQATPQPVNATVWQNVPAGDQPECLACGGSKKVLQLTDDSRYQPGACPVCEPARRVG
jgi:hypothetical protein